MSKKFSQLYQQINEILDNPLSWKWTKTPKTQSWVANVTTSGSTDIEFRFQKVRNLNDAINDAGAFIYSFTRKKVANQNKNLKLNQQDKKLGITGTGNQFRIFATAHQILFDFIKKRKPGKVIWMADINEPTRIRLYDTFFEKIRKSPMIAGYLPSTPFEAQYSLVKKQPGQK